MRGAGVFCTMAAAGAASAVEVSQWYGRSIYFVMTDRFAKTESGGDEDEVCNGGGWCGGTLRGVERKLDYIQGMGFDAIWITPVAKQVEWTNSLNETGYHGYWASDFMQIDPHLGTDEDLISLKKSCKERGMLLMLDIVANHVGPIDSLDKVSQLGAPLNSQSCEQFHQLGRGANESLAEYLQHPLHYADAGNCYPYYNIGVDCNYTELLDGWFSELADLKQENPEVRKYLLSWIEQLKARYDIDGFRLDTAMYMPRDFLKEFQEAAGVYMIGEVTTLNFTWHSSFTSSLTGLLNFPVTGQVKEAFNRSGSMSNFSQLLSLQATEGYPDLNLLGNFVDNHDMARFLYTAGDNELLLQNALAWAMLHHGLPIVYYGTEQHDVASARDERTSMWPHFGQTAMYQFLAALNGLRRDHGLATQGAHATELAQPIGAGQDYLAFTRGALLVLLTNIGEDRSVRACLPLEDFHGAWSKICAGANAKLVLGEADARCFETEFCVELFGGKPAALALQQDVVV